jgi:hypothetical protein
MSNPGKPFYMTATPAEMRASLRLYKQQANKCCLTCCFGEETIMEYLQHQCQTNSTEAKRMLVRVLLGAKTFGAMIFVWMRAELAPGWDGWACTVSVLVWFAWICWLYTDLVAMSPGEVSPCVTGPAATLGGMALDASGTGSQTVDAYLVSLPQTAASSESGGGLATPIPDGPSSARMSPRVVQIESLVTHCEKCRHDRPPLAHHCRHCGFCVRRMVRCFFDFFFSFLLFSSDFFFLVFNSSFMPLNPLK